MKEEKVSVVIGGTEVGELHTVVAGDLAVVNSNLLMPIETAKKSVLRTADGKEFTYDSPGKQYYFFRAGKKAPVKKAPTKKAAVKKVPAKKKTTRKKKE